MTPSLQEDDSEKASALLALRHSTEHSTTVKCNSTTGGMNPIPVPCDNDNNKGDQNDDGCCERETKRLATSTDSDGGQQLNGFTPAAARMNPAPESTAAAATEDLNGSRASMVSLSSRSTVPPRSVPFEELPSNVDEARVQLAVVFGLEEWCDCGDQEHVLETLSMFPVLTMEQFKDSNGSLFHPLVHLMFIQAALEPIQEVCNLWPDVLALPQGGDQNLPLHIACVMDDYDDVIAFLARSYPLALTKYNGSGMLPLHRAMAKKRITGTEKATFALLRFLLGLYPQSVAYPTSMGLTALDYAFHEEYDIFVLYYILESLPLEMQMFCIGKSHHGKPVIMDLDKVRVLERILPQTQHLSCEPAFWTPEGLLLLMHCLKNKPATTTKVRLKVGPEDMNSECRFTLKQALELNTNLEQLCLACPEEDAGKDSGALLQSARNGVYASRGLRFLQLVHYKGRMLDLITCGPTVKVVNGAQLVFTDLAADWNPSMDALRSSPLESLTLASCDMHPASLRKLLEQLEHMPLLNSLSLDNVGGSFRSDGSNESTRQQFDMTTPLLALLGKGRLKSLTLGTFPVLDFEPLCESLKRNTTLQFLNAPSCFDTDSEVKEQAIVDLLSQHNTALLQVNTGTCNEQINHYTTLNACGRGRACDDTTTRQQFIEHICSVVLINALDDQLKQSVVYGLLRESPGKWSLGEEDGTAQLSPNSRKRRRNNVEAS